MRPVIFVIAFLALLNIIQPSLLFKPLVTTQDPIIQVNLLHGNKNYDLFEYILPSPVPVPIPGISQPPPPRRLQSNLSLSFNTEKILFWVNKNTSHSYESKSKYWELKLQLTCRAPYFTKWRFNSGANFSNSEEFREEQDENYMRYNIQLFPRDNEDPLQLLKNVEKPTEYNLTSLTINWFSTGYKSGFIDCVNPSNDTMKSRLHIFQRYGDPNISPFTTNKGQNLSWTGRPTIPCTVHDPDIKPNLEYNYKTLSSWQDFSNSSFFRYNWKTGFKWVRKNNASDQFRQYKYRCSYKSIHTTPYAFEFNQEPATSTNTAGAGYNSFPRRRKAKAFDIKLSDIVKTKVVPFSHQNGAKDFLQFKCKLDQNLNLIGANGLLLKSMSLSSCVSPDYCFPSLISDAFSTVNCAGSVSPSLSLKLTGGQCELTLPFGNYVNRSDSDAASIGRQGKVTCFVEDANHKQEIRTQHFYFTGLSGNMHVLPTSKDNSPLPLSAMQLNDIVLIHMNTTYDSNSLATVQLSCKSLKFFTFPSIQFSITYCNGTTELLKSQNITMTIDFNGSIDPNNYNYKEVTMPLELVNELEIYKVNCHVPLFNSTTWLNVSVKWPGSPTGSELIGMDHLAFNRSVAFKNCSDFAITKNEEFNDVKFTPTEVPEIESTVKLSNYSSFPSGVDFEQDLTKAEVDDSAVAYEDQDQDTIAAAETTVSQNTETIPTSPVSATENIKEVAPGFDQKGIILGMSVAFVCIFIAAVVTIVLIAMLIHRRKIGRLERRIRELTNAEMQAFFEGHAITRESENDPNYTYALIDSQPFNRDFEIERERLEIFHNKVLGSGEFGLVLYGMLQSLDSADNVVVAVKSVKPNVDTASFKTFLTELKVMCYVGEHPNIVSLLGAVTSNIQNREVYMALEFCAKGDLQGFLTKNRANFKNLFPQNKRNTQCFNGAYKMVTSATHATTSFSYTELEHEQSADVGVTVTDGSHLFSTLELIDWAFQVSSGMEFISSKNVIHGDLAARNVLLTAEKVAKISDFGLSRHLQNYTVYMKKTQTRLPWKWMAIESLRDMEFSVQSDVWAFGVTLFEIFSLGTSPYPGRNWTNQFVDDLIGGLRLPSPQFGNSDIVTLMMDCMKQYPGQRITFPEIVQKLEGIKIKTGERFQL